MIMLVEKLLRNQKWNNCLFSSRIFYRYNISPVYCTFELLFPGSHVSYGLVFPAFSLRYVVLVTLRSLNPGIKVGTLD